ncbi:hypothetical protein BSKO_08048 [Bryopsis sp. KO-2023]|nr:hypothetical protein BSKO_08048 [Bryopsis sp. KO-2023]
MSDRKVLSYHDIVLRESDVELLKGPAWLNDLVIEFYFEYLSREVFDNAEDFAFLGGSVAYLIAGGSPQDLVEMLKPLKLPDKKFIFIPVNNNPDVGEVGGSHWSLLVLDRERWDFCHFDSLQGVNASQARGLAMKVATLADVDPPFGYIEVPDAPQQANGHDCGLYVLAVGEAICSAHFRGKRRNEDFAKELRKISPDRVEKLRQVILGIVMAKSREQQRTQ